MKTEHRLEVVASDDFVRRGAQLLAAAIQAAIDRRGRCVFAISGGSTPRPVFDALATTDIDWPAVTIVQVDERIAPSGSPERNLTDQLEALGATAAQWLPLPVSEDRATSLAAVPAFVAALEAVAGSPPVLDVVHLGLGADGHTASLVPGDAAIDVLDQAVVATAEPYQGTHRLTLTRPVLERAERVIWLVAGEDKAQALAGLVAGPGHSTGDEVAPAARLRFGPDRSVILTDISLVDIGLTEVGLTDRDLGGDGPAHALA